MPWSRCTPILLAILLLGFLVRVQALQWNWFMHADSIDGVMGAATFLRDGRLTIFDGPSLVDPALYTLPPSGGEPLVQHAPVWPLLGAVFTAMRGESATMVETFVSLRMLSVLAGMLVILLSFLIAVRLLDRVAGLAAAAWIAASYVLIDYAGNGALYTFQAALYLLWVLIALQPSSLRRTILLGGLSGITYLVNFQAVILVPAGLVLLALQERRVRRVLLHATMFLSVAVLIASPWLIRNVIVFGDPLASHAANMWYVYAKAGFHVPDGEVLRLDIRDHLSLLAGVFHTWLPYNLYYAARKLFILAPIAFLFFSFGLVDLAFSPSRLRMWLPVLVVLAFHVLISASWPIWKFRFFVPLLPLVFLLALEELWHLPLTRWWRNVGVSSILTAIILLSIMTYHAVPTHTTYYDGALTQDPFHGSEERTFLKKWGILPSDAP